LKRATTDIPSVKEFMRNRCPECRSVKSELLKNGKRKCLRCGFEWRTK